MATQDDVVGNDGTEIQTITVDGKEVSIDEAPSVISDLERSLRADWTRKTQEAADLRRAADSEKSELAMKLEADKRWLNEHDPSIYHLYEPTVDGGRGFIGTPNQIVKSGATSQVADSQFKADSEEVSSLKKQLAEMQAKIEGVSSSVRDIGMSEVKSNRDTLMQKYPNASIREVNLALDYYNRQTGKHPNKGEIEKIIKESHDFVTSKTGRPNIEKGKPGDAQAKSAMPDATPSPPGGTVEKPKSIDGDFDGFLAGLKKKISG